MAIELDPADRITVGAVGQPGQRTFYIQARQGETLVTLVVQKQQVELLSASVVEILARVGKETGEGPAEEELELEEPLIPEWTAGRLSIGYEQERDLMVLEAEELLDEEEDEEEEEEAEEAEEEADLIRLWASREQMLALARQGVAVAARGRPRCRYCGNPMDDPEDHLCPAMNGHRPVTEV